MPSIDPIGLSPFECQNTLFEEMAEEKDKKRMRYEVDNINVTEFIDGHLLYRANMKNIARLIGIKD